MGIIGISGVSIAVLGIIGGAFWKMRTKGRSHGGEFQLFYESFESILDAARTLYGQSEKLQKIVASEGSAVQKSSAAVEEIAAMLEKTSSGASTLADLSKSSAHSADEGEKQVAQVNSLLQDVKGSSQELETKVASSLTDLGKIVTSLNSIKIKTSMINDIVFQTKLLSFNASVEAARAGESGRGFAVVAEEMGKLARSSGTASLEIDSILTTSLKETNELIEQVTKSLQALTAKNVTSVDHALSESTKTVENFKTLIELVRKTSNMSSEISAAAREQDIGVREVSESLIKLQNSSGELGQVAETVFKTSFALSNKTDELGQKFIMLSKNSGTEIKSTVKKFDFNAAISAHIDWKMKLSKYMQKPDGSLIPEKVCLDNTCALGKWLYGDGTVYKESHQKIYEELRHSHAQFHKTASTIITMIDQNRLSEAQKLLAPGGSYLTISETTVELIRTLQSYVETESTTERSAQKAA